MDVRESARFDQDFSTSTPPSVSKNDKQKNLRNPKNLRTKSFPPKNPMFHSLSHSSKIALPAPWETYQAFYDQLETHPLTPDTLHEWMSGWSWVMELLGEVSSRLYVAYVQNTADEEAEKRFFAFLETIEPQTRAADQKLTVKLLESRHIVPPEWKSPSKECASTPTFSATKTCPHHRRTQTRRLRSTKSPEPGRSPGTAKSKRSPVCKSPTNPPTVPARGHVANHRRPPPS